MAPRFRKYLSIREATTCTRRTQQAAMSIACILTAISAGCSTATSVNSASNTRVSEAYCLTTIQKQSWVVSAGQPLWAFQHNAGSIAVACGTLRRLSDDNKLTISSTSTARGSGVDGLSGARAPNTRRSLLLTSDQQDDRNERRSGVREDDSHVLTRQVFLGGVASSAVEKAAALAAIAVAVAGSRPTLAFAEAGTAKSIQDIKKGIEADFLDGRYYVTGNLTPSLYRRDCLFTDPTTRVAGVEKYTNAVKLLFDPDNAQIDLLSLEIEDDGHLLAKWRLQGYLKFPWHPYVSPYTGTTRYSVDSDGLIFSHEETWSISALDAVKATLTPTAGPRTQSAVIGDAGSTNTGI